jgi:hypothetical protein
LVIGHRQGEALGMVGQAQANRDPALGRLLCQLTFECLIAIAVNPGANLKLGGKRFAVAQLREQAIAAVAFFGPVDRQAMDFLRGVEPGDPITIVQGCLAAQLEAVASQPADRADFIADELGRFKSADIALCGRSRNSRWRRG